MLTKYYFIDKSSIQIQEEYISSKTQIGTTKAMQLSFSRIKKIYLKQKDIVQNTIILN